MLDVPLTRREPAVTVARGARSLPDLFLRRAAASRRELAWKAKRGGAWAPTTWGEFEAQALAVATWLLDHGIAAGDKIVMVGSTRPEWCVCDMGGQLAGAVTVGAYPTLAPGQLAYLVDHADARVAFVEGRADVQKILAIKGELPKLERVMVWDPAGLEEELAAHGWLGVFAEVTGTEADRARVEARAGAVDPGETAVLVYTSGTTGPPKGAMITHENILAAMRGMEEQLGFERGDIGLSFLPMAHVGERIISFYQRINAGVATAFASSVPAVLEELREVRPTFFGSVPRLFEKAHAGILAQAEKAPPARRAVFRWALGVGLAVVARWQAGEPLPLALRLQYRVADRLVLSRIREAFGGRVRWFMVGAAPTPRAVLELFWAAGMRLYEIYGMTEATALTHQTVPGSVRLGSVGKALPHVEDRVAEDGEVLLRGPTVFKGYYKDPEATAEAIDAEGWLHSGDIGKKDADGNLTIIDRKKHIIITAGGKNITPAYVEGEIKAADPLISQVHVHGDRRPYCTALVTISPLEAISWARARGLAGEAEVEALRRALIEDPLGRPPGLAGVMARVTADPEVRRRVAEAARKANARLSRVEAVKRVHLLDRELSLEEDEITPTLKVKRKNVETKHAATFDRLYADESSGIVVEEPRGER